MTTDPATTTTLSDHTRIYYVRRMLDNLRASLVFVTKHH